MNLTMTENKVNNQEGSNKACIEILESLLDNLKTGALTNTLLSGETVGEDKVRFVIEFLGTTEMELEQHGYKNEKN